MSEGRPADVYERELSPEELDARLERIRSNAEEIAEMDDLIRWFSTRYPTPGERLAYAKRKARELRRARGAR